MRRPAARYSACAEATVDKILDSIVDEARRLRASGDVEGAAALLLASLAILDAAIAGVEATDGA